MHAMRRTFRIALFVIIALGPLSAGAIELTEDPGGFDGRKWGTPVGEMPPLVPLKSDGEFKTFSHDGPTPPIGEIATEAIQYRFYKERLESVTVRYRGDETHQKLVAYLANRFGRITSMKSTIVRYADWQGPETLIAMKFDAVNSVGVLLFSSRALHMEHFREIEISGR